MFVCPPLKNVSVRRVHLLRLARGAGLTLALGTLLACSDDLSPSGNILQPDSGGVATEAGADAETRDRDDDAGRATDVAGGPGPDASSGPDIDAGPDDVTANPGNPNNRMLDADCDALSDQEEFAAIYPGNLKTSPVLRDTDGDGLPDGLELGRTSGVSGVSCSPRFDQDPTSVTSPVEADTDRDQLPDGLEDANGNGRVDAGETDPTRADSDGDGLPDGLEDANQNGRVDAGETDPRRVDTDADGVADGVEDRNRNGQVDPGEWDPTSPDTDGESLQDGDEDVNFNGLRETFETDPTSSDSDCDGLTDAAELAARPPTSPLNPDTDGDGLGDGLEAGLSTISLPAECTNTPPIDQDTTTTTSLTERDTDGDGLPDGVEDANGNGRVDPGETDPNAADTDMDGLSDGDEVRANFDPLDRNDPGSDGVTGVNDICAQGSLKVVNYNVEPGVWTLAHETSTQYQARSVGSAGSGVKLATLDDATNQVAGFVMEVPLLTGAADIAAQVTALESRIQAGVGGEGLTYVLRASPRNITSHDGFATAVSGLIDIGASSSRNAAAVRNSMVRLVSNLPGTAFSGLPTTVGAPTRAFVYEFQVLYRPASASLLVVGGVLAQSLFDNRADQKSIALNDLTNGTALAQADAGRDKDCDPFPAAGQAVVDFLWMADISGSTDDDRGRIVQAADTVWQELARNNVDFRMGVVPHIENSFSGGTGTLRGTGFTTNLTDFRAYLADTTGNDGCEYGLEAIRDALDTALPRSAVGTTSATKLRGSATLAVVYISDEFADEVQDVQCASRTLPCTTNLGDFFSSDDDTVCAQTPTQSCIDQIVAPYISELQAENALAFAQVIQPNGTPTNCSGYSCPGSSVENEPGRGYIEVVNATGGVFYSPCSNTPGNALRPIIDAVTGAASQYQLLGDPISSTIRVGVVRNGTTVVVPRDKQNGFDYDPASNSIFFRGTAFRPAQGELVVASYRLWEAPPPPCPPGQVRDASLGICICDTALCNQNCGPNEVCDSDCNCACTLDCNGNCAVGEVCNQTTCECECPSDCGGCPTGTTCNQATCQCECDDCGGACENNNTTCNEASCACECLDCGGACTGNTVCNDSLCECACPDDCRQECPGFAECDPTQNCACVCPANCDDLCGAGTVCDETTCACQCPPGCDEACPGSQVCDPANGCACECPADCGGCGANERCDSATCQCVPRS